MRLIIDGKEFYANISPDKEGYVVTVGKKKLNVRRRGQHYIINNKKHTARLYNREDNTYNVSIDQDNYSVELAKEEPEMITEIRAPMNGVVMSIDTKAGQEAKKGKTLLSIMSMKMENEIKADRRCKILEVKAKPKQKVAKGDILITLEPENEK